MQGDKETERGALPVLLWPEQRRYLDDIGGIGQGSPSGQQSKGNNSDGKALREKAVSKGKKRTRELEEQQECTQDVTISGGGREQEKKCEGAIKVGDNTSSSSNPSSLHSKVKVENVDKGEVAKLPVVRGYSNDNPQAKRVRTSSSSSTSLLLYLPLYGMFSSVASTLSSLFGFFMNTTSLASFFPSESLSHDEQRWRIFKKLQDLTYFVGPADVYGG